MAERIAIDLMRGSEKLLHERLSDREFQVFRALGSGKSVKEIADALNLSVKTVSTYRTHILTKTGLRNNAPRKASRGAVSWAGPSAWRQAPWDQDAAERIPGSSAEQSWAAELSDTARALSQLSDEQREALILVGANFGRKAKAIHARHIHVGNHHMELGAPQPGEGINSVHGGLDLITRGFENVLKQAA